MRLLSTTPTAIPHLREFIGSHIPPYAILSHTWVDDGSDPPTSRRRRPVRAAGARTLRQGPARLRSSPHARRPRICVGRYVLYCYKRSSAELSEAINSMFAWHRDAEVCYVYLSDLEPGEEGDLRRDLPGCRWFSRWWTLQELVAPRKVLFFDREWNYRGSKEELAPLLYGITNIPVTVLCHQADLGDIGVARRMSWAANRETTRLEDMAYCLLGIFDVNLSLIYGEGIKAFARLQAAILQTTPDLSIFAWADTSDTCPKYAGMLATSPAPFAGNGSTGEQLGLC
ncbi:hypothetical protein CHGG_08600 [Chaetomium globosum CBS 148.51]|uniref:DUF8212 domain-containing protein n=1 Tax=Chaetomium globosum (strain ATCC 6205 / CBS 148.51 / DSM 1962 / NBRC 6347 / NRRL 1970) TaxID=306901 RepID=Q2GTV4_CHAGB|nr:uncharacterized protein CHGG_08600 [Chaetomium globosum CBS 148.51]EAQ84586.1 hypothetical protein CHGG_08600 [Chaetomium globosum CBS 148.51]